MSKLHEELLAEEGFWAEFDVLISQRNYDAAGALMQKAGDLGYENLALRMHQAINRAVASDNERLDREKEERLEYGTLSDEAVDEDGN